MRKRHCDDKDEVAKRETFIGPACMGMDGCSARQIGEDDTRLTTLGGHLVHHLISRIGFIIKKSTYNCAS